MPNITASGTYTKDTAGFEKLAATANKRSIVINGTLGTSLSLEYVDDQGTQRQLESVTVPYSKELTLNLNLVLVSVGSPNLNVSIA